MSVSLSKFSEVLLFSAELVEVKRVGVEATVKVLLVEETKSFELVLSGDSVEREEEELANRLAVVDSLLLAEEKRPLFETLVE